MVTKEDFPNCCHYCEFRHSGCCSEEEILKSFYTNECNYFIPGKCYYCAVHQGAVDDDEKWLVCSEAFYPDGCENFKEGVDYDIFLKYIKESNSLQDENKDDIVLIKNSARAQRRRLTRRHNARLRLIAEIDGNYPGPYISDRKGRVINPGRGRISKYLKKQSNRKIRRYKNRRFHGGNYRKLFDYWWELI